MRRIRFRAEQMIGAEEQTTMGALVVVANQKTGISEQAVYCWKTRDILRDFLPVIYSAISSYRVLPSLALLFTFAIPSNAQQADSGKPDRSLQGLLEKFTVDSPGAWTPEQLTTMARIRDAAISDPYAYTELAHLTNNIGPRLGGSLQAQTAVDWVAAEMRLLGAHVTLEKTTVPHWVRGEETAELTSWPDATPRTRQKIVVTALGGSIATPKEGLEAQVIVVDSFAALRAVPKDVITGKILIFNHPFDKQLAADGQGLAAYEQGVFYRALGPATGALAGAVAVLVRSIGGADFRLPHTGGSIYGDGATRVPAGAITAEDADLLATLAKQGSVTLRLTLTPQTLPDALSYNVIADWPGTEHPEQIVMVSGHLDSWDLGTGAIDDGTGVAMSMQAIHILQKLGLHPRRTVRFVAWMGEESGSQGAATYAREHESEIDDHIAVLEDDFGCDHPVGITYSGSSELEHYLKPITETLAPIGASLVSRGDEIGEDVAPLINRGVPGLTPTQDSRTYFNYHHTAADTLDKIDPHQLAESAAVIAVTAYALADAATPAPRRISLH